MTERIVTLPEGYDPASDHGRTVVELFLDEDEPPLEIRVEPISETRWIAVARWGDDAA